MFKSELKKEKGGESLNKKFLVAAVALVVVAMLASPLLGTAEACRWHRKNAETFYVDQRFWLTPYLESLANPKYFPSEDNPLVLIIGPYESQIRECTINVGETEYVEGVDFEYTGSEIYAVWRPNGTYFGGTYPLGDIMMYKVTYTYDFGAYEGGIDGKINMRAIWISNDFMSFVEPGSIKVTSLQGTGNLQHVKIIATNAGSESDHTGTVIGWPTP